MTELAADDFNRADDADLGVNWTNVSGAGSGFQIVSNKAEPDDIAADQCMRWVLDVFPDDQYSEAALENGSSVTAGVGPGLAVRIAASGQSFYRFVANHQVVGDNCELGKFVSGSYTTIDTFAQAWVDDDVWRLQVSGSTLTVYLNSTLVDTQTDTDLASGQPGIAYSSDAGTSAWDFWAAGDSGAGPISGTHVVTDRGSFTFDGAPTFLSTSMFGIPSRLSGGAAEPINWYHAGMISWGTASNGAMVAYPVTRELDLVQIPAGCDTLWYEFADGITATIVELGAP